MADLRTFILIATGECSRTWSVQAMSPEHAETLWRTVELEGELIDADDPGSIIEEDFESYPTHLRFLFEDTGPGMLAKIIDREEKS